jgi:fatty-acyl-CoA synthase
LLTHRGLAGNGRSYAEVIGAGADDVWVNPMPLFHTAGCGLATLGAMQTGGVHVIPPEFDPANILDLVDSEHGTTMLCVPTMLMRLLDEADAGGRTLASWRLVTLGGAPVPPELVRRAEDRLGVTVAIGFGQTEASPYVTHSLPRDPHPDWVTTVGRALPHVEIRIADPGGGATLPLDTVGEICTRSAFVMRGYFDDPEATARVLDPDGWLHTGDLGSMDRHGYVRIQGRLKDMIIRGGENVYPREVEDVLFEHPSVVGAAVLGVPDEEWGEVVAAYVQLRPDHAVTGEEMERFCRQHLASFKVPRIWRIVDEFPQTASGKIQKFVLRDRLLAERAAAAPEGWR